MNDKEAKWWWLGLAVLAVLLLVSLFGDSKLQVSVSIKTGPAAEESQQESTDGQLPENP